MLKGRRLTRLLSVSTILRTRFGDTFVSLYMWLSFYKCTRNWLYCWKTRHTFRLFSGQHFEFRHGQSNDYFLAYFYQNKRNLTILKSSLVVHSYFKDEFWKMLVLKIKSTLLALHNWKRFMYIFIFLTVYLSWVSILLSLRCQMLSYVRI